jgi:putative spermidine/putrescine transport system permease protein
VGGEPIALAVMPRGAGSGAADPLSRSLRRSLRRSRRRGQVVAAAFVAPLLVFTLLVFVLPIGDMLRRSFWNAELAAAWPGLRAAMGAWRSHGGHGVPPEPVFAALAEDLRRTFGTPPLATAARRLNYDLENGRSLVFNAARRVAQIEQPAGTWTDTLTGIDRRWAAPETWAAIDRARVPFTDFFLLAALDLQRDENGLARKPAQQAIYLEVLGRTFSISLAVTLACLVLGFPVAYVIAAQPPSRANLLLMLVLLPFWTPLLVRTASWVVVLQENGLANQLLVALRLIDRPLRLIYNRTGVLVAMTHVLLPFMILPLYSVMRSVPPGLMRAALSLGAPPFTAFRRVYLPQVMPGVAAGALLVFILALGYYITPALVGGGADQMISTFVAFNTTDTANWSLAAALGTVLLAATFVLFAIATRLGGRYRLGVLG